MINPSGGKRRQEAGEKRRTEMKKYRYFGAMLDCSRNAVMKPEAVKKFIDCLAKLGYNALELYTEDTFRPEGEPYFG